MLKKKNPSCSMYVRWSVSDSQQRERCDVEGEPSGGGTGAALRMLSSCAASARRCDCAGDVSHSALRIHAVIATLSGARISPARMAGTVGTHPLHEVHWAFLASRLLSASAHPSNFA